MRPIRHAQRGTRLLHRETTVGPGEATHPGLAEKAFPRTLGFAETGHWVALLLALGRCQRLARPVFSRRRAAVMQTCWQPGYILAMHAADRPCPSRIMTTECPDAFA